MAAENILHSQQNMFSLGSYDTTLFVNDVASNYYVNIEGLKLYEEDGIIWCWEVLHLSGVAEYAGTEVRIHWQNGQVLYFTLAQNTSDALHLNSNILYFDYILGRFWLPSYSGI